MKKYLFIGITIIVVIAIVIAVVIIRNNNTQTQTTTTATKEITKVNVNEVTRSVFYAPQYVAIAKGFMEEEGIKVELTTGQGADKVMTAVLAGQSDIGFARTRSSNLHL